MRPIYKKNRKARRQKAIIQARWRERHPICALWHRCKYNASKRGIAWIWSREEFYEFCRLTGYHILVKDGYTIERKNPLKGYELKNCEILPFWENSAKGGLIDKIIRERSRKRLAKCAA